MSIQAIQTHYDGYHFRSRLEARWAVFFNTANIPYRYEHQGYKTPHGYYLPDFEIDLYDGTKFFEVKPNSWFKDTSDSYFLDCKRQSYVAENTGIPLVISGDFASLSKLDSSGRAGNSDTDVMQIEFPDGSGDYLYEFTVCPACLEIGIEFEARAARMTCCTLNPQKLKGDWDHQGDHVKLLDAYTAALSARFEHGEKPAA
ncbi:hypothetical protein [Pasteurella phage PMP-GADVASU-IND]|nr:hypothetical protein [Pasteurella phage PMP-GADVASU-IND]